LKKCRIRPIDYAPYSPDLTPSDFCLFGKLKGALAGQELKSTEKLLVIIRGHWLYQAVFDAWKRKLSKCIQMKGESIAEGESKRLRENPSPD
jgi:hypothetical protein